MQFIQYDLDALSRPSINFFKSNCINQKSFSHLRLNRISSTVNKYSKKQLLYSKLTEFRRHALLLALFIHNTVLRIEHGRWCKANSHVQRRRVFFASPFAPFPRPNFHLIKCSFHDRQNWPHQQIYIIIYDLSLF